MNRLTEIIYDAQGRNVHLAREHSYARYSNVTFASQLRLINVLRDAVVIPCTYGWIYKPSN